MPEEAEENQKGKVRLIERILGRPVAIVVEKPELPSLPKGKSIVHELLRHPPALIGKTCEIL